MALGILFQGGLVLRGGAAAESCFGTGNPLSNALKIFFGEIRVCMAVCNGLTVLCLKLPFLTKQCRECRWHGVLSGFCFKTCETRSGFSATEQIEFPYQKLIKIVRMFSNVSFFLNRAP